MRVLLLAGVLVGRLLVANDSPETACVRRVYADLVRVASDGRRPPNLVIRSGNETAGGFRAAMYDQRTRQITVDERVVRYCLGKARPQGEGCLAFLLGHELAHFYKDHAWGMDFPSGLSGSSERPEGALSTAQLSALEAQADQAGGLYAHLAGYAVLPLVPQILADIYQMYGIEDRIPGYPSLEERKQIAVRADAALGRMTGVFDLGLLLFLLNRHEESARCFDWVAQSFPSREILNNAAVAKALAAAALFPAGRRALQYPWTLDGESRLAAKPEQQRGEEEEPSAERRERLLREAKAELTEALNKDADYPVSQFNLALVEDLLEEYGSAEDHLKEACASHSAAVLPQELCREARAIIAANSTGKGNWAPLSGDKVAAAKAGPILDGLPDPGSVRFTADSGETVIIPASSGLQSALNIESRKTFSFSALRLRLGSERLVLLDGDAQSGPLAGFFARLVQAPDQKLRTASGFIEVYASSRLFVFCDKSSHMVRWMRFQWAD